MRSFVDEVALSWVWKDEEVDSGCGEEQKWPMP